MNYKHICNLLKNKQTILYPTDTIWGIGCDATNVDAVKKIYDIKQREESKALICLVSSFEMLISYVEDIPEQVHEILKEASKPTTVIYNSPRNFASNLIAADQTIAIRLVNKGFAHELIKTFGKPIVSTSANVSGNPSPKDFKEIDERILKGVDYVVNLPDFKS
ncbi:MAG: L-threonylcarbamoyladenylate synthase, partial [Flavobacteriaceae bacterium]